MKHSLQKSGFEIKKQFLHIKQVQELIDLLDGKIETVSAHGVRNIFSKIHELASIIQEQVLLPLLGESFVPIKTVYFDKVPEKNWNVAWHQDTAINVVGDIPTDGFKNCLIKRGYSSVEPPEKIMQNISTVRIHLDDASVENGCLRVIPGTHKYGRVQSERLLKTVAENEIYDCEMNCGDVMIMKPLLFHSSRKSINPSHRRVIHVECSPDELPNGLDWYEACN